MGWISVRDRLPEEKKVIPVYHTEHGFCIGSYGWGQSKVWHIVPFKKGWIVPFSEQVTHWFPIPDLPKPEPPLPRCPRCNIALSFTVVNKPTTSHMYWECPRCGKETYPIEETKIRGESRDQSTEQPEPLFCVEKRFRYWPPKPDLSKPPLPPWGIYHRTRGWIGDNFEKKTAQKICDRLNELWQLEKDSR